MVAALPPLIPFIYGGYGSVGIFCAAKVTYEVNIIFNSTLWVLVSLIVSSVLYTWTSIVLKKNAKYIKHMTNGTVKSRSNTSGDQSDLVGLSAKHSLSRTFSVMSTGMNNITKIRTCKSNHELQKESHVKQQYNNTDVNNVIDIEIGPMKNETVKTENVRSPLPSLNNLYSTSYGSSGYPDIVGFTLSNAGHEKKKLQPQTEDVIDIEIGIEDIDIAQSLDKIEPLPSFDNLNSSSYASEYKTLAGISEILPAQRILGKSNSINVDSVISVNTCTMGMNSIQDNEKPKRSPKAYTDSKKTDRLATKMLWFVFLYILQWISNVCAYLSRQTATIVYVYTTLFCIIVFFTNAGGLFNALVYGYLISRKGEKT
eukprot:Awhi_evm1s1389